MRLLLYISILCMASATHGQQANKFQRVHKESGVFMGYDILQHNDGGYVYTGLFKGWTTNRSAGIVKTNELGEIQWSNGYGKFGNKFGYRGTTIRRTIDNGYVITGITTDYPLFQDIYLMKTDDLGNVQWAKTYGTPSPSEDQQAWDVIQLATGEFVIAGTFTVAGAANPYLIKTDDMGNIIWIHRYDTPGGNENSFSITETYDGGYVVTGWSENGGAGNRDVLVYKADSLGNMLWYQMHGGSNTEMGMKIREATNHDLIVAGYTESFSGTEDGFVLRLTETGDLIWASAYDSGGDDRIEDVLELPNGDLMLAGMFETSAFGGEDAVLLKLNSTGGVQFAHAYGGADSDGFQALKTTMDGGFILSGHTHSFGSGTRDIYLVKTDENGISGCHEQAITVSVTAPTTINTTPVLVLPTPVGQVLSTYYETSVETLIDTGLCFSCVISGGAPDTLSICQGDSVYVGGAWQTTAGVYFDSLVSIAGCDSTVSTVVVVNPIPLASAGSDIIIELGHTTTLLASGGVSYQWYSGAGLSCTACASPQVTPTGPSSYCVEVTSSAGCKDSACVNVDVQISCEDLFIPSAFSPNADGANDELCIYGHNCLSNMTFMVYNRWGEKVFQSTDPTVCWDGTRNGQVLNSAVFVYYLTGTLLTGDEVNLKGNVSLLK